jgi:glycosyltransferase involved in cell wall biosynthesis
MVGSSGIVKKRLLFIVNVDWFFLSHRLPIALEALKLGYEVHIASGITDKVDVLRSHGLIVHPLAIGRSSTNLAREVRTFLGMLVVLQKVRPHIVHLVTIKPVIYGGIAARLAGVSGVVSAISGLGFVFLAKGWKATVVRSLVARLYRLALGKRNVKVIFQNPDDRKTLMQAAGLQNDKVVMIRGSGVDLSTYAMMPLPKEPSVVVMAARLLRDKGVYEFVSAARILKQRGVNSRFWLVGDPDAGNPASVNEAELSVWRSEGAVELLGHRSDIASVFAQSHIVVLPSYREGLPRVLIEAAACGRAVVTTDVPGCRDAIEPGVTGLLVPPRDAVALADAIQHLLLDAELLQRMGQAGRQLAERGYSIEKVVSAHLEVYRDLMEAVA